MKIPYGTSVPAPENREAEAGTGAALAAAAMLGAPRTTSAIGQLTREAYQKLRQDGVTVDVLSVDRRGFLGTLFSAGALVLGASFTADDACAAAAAWQPSVYLGFEP
ncbi:MAG TPA: hypothetical protein VES20_05850, partial [Bryobacteraceae bacterium]|nr:hypothetical protein [Bryobacteraceae bacterium]